MSDDITFCMKGLDECLVSRCERHPHNITDRTIPHSFAQFYETENCPLIKKVVSKGDMVEVVRCKDCRYWDKTKYSDYATMGECLIWRAARNWKDYCSEGRAER